MKVSSGNLSKPQSPEAETLRGQKKPQSPEAETLRGQNPQDYKHSSARYYLTGVYPS
jgi:hypothetical protein